MSPHPAGPVPADTDTHPMAPGPASRRRSFIRRSLRSPLASSTAIMTIGMGIRLLLQMLSFLIVAGSMGAREFGAFVSVAALVNIVGAFAGWGGDQLIVRRAARVRTELPKAMGSALVFLGLSGPPLALLSFALVPWLVDASIPWRIVLFVVLSDVFFARINVFTAAAFQAVDRPFGTVWANVGFTAARVTAALIWVSVTSTHSAASWAGFYFAGSALAGSLSLWSVCRSLGYPTWRTDWSEWRDGFHFALQMASFAAYGNIDKPVIAALSNLSTAGLYAAAFRLIDAASVPIRAFLYSTYARFFQVGAEGPRASLKLAVRMLPFAVGFGLLGSLGAVAAAPLAPRILGHSYAGTGTIMLLLAPLPMFMSIYYMGADALVSSGYTGMRTLVQIAMPPINIGLCAILVPSHGAEGAAVAALLTNVALAGGAWLAAGFVARRSAPASGGVALR